MTRTSKKMPIKSGTKRAKEKMSAKKMAIKSGTTRQAKEKMSAKKTSSFFSSDTWSDAWKGAYKERMTLFEEYNTQRNRMGIEPAEMASIHALKNYIELMTTHEHANKTASMKTAPMKTVSMKTAPTKTASMKTAPMKTVSMKTAPTKTASMKTESFFSSGKWHDAWHAAHKERTALYEEYSTKCNRMGIEPADMASIHTLKKRIASMTK